MSQLQLQLSCMASLACRGSAQRVIKTLYRRSCKCAAVTLRPVHSPQDAVQGWATSPDSACSWQHLPYDPKPSNLRDCRNSCCQIRCQCRLPGWYAHFIRRVACRSARHKAHSCRVSDSRPTALWVGLAAAVGGLALGGRVCHSDGGVLVLPEPAHPVSRHIQDNIGWVKDLAAEPGMQQVLTADTLQHHKVLKQDHLVGHLTSSRGYA